MLKKIDSFTGKFGFLSNFHPSPFFIQDVRFETVEHAYQAYKATTIKDFEYIRTQPTAAKAKRAGRIISVRPDWEEAKVDIMTMMVGHKFKDETLARKLLATLGAELIEGNTWNDTFWGVCGGIGLNMLGGILMKHRDIIAENVLKY